MPLLCVLFIMAAILLSFSKSFTLKSTREIFGHTRHLSKLQASTSSASSGGRASAAVVSSGGKSKADSNESAKKKKMDLNPPKVPCLSCQHCILFHRSIPFSPKHFVLFKIHPCPIKASVALLTHTIFPPFMSHLICTGHKRFLPGRLQASVLDFRQMEEHC